MQESRYPCRNITTMCRKIAYFWVRAEILLSRDKCPWNLMQGHFWGSWRNIDCWRNIHLCPHTPTCFVYLPDGSLPVSAILHKPKLSLLRMIARQGDGAILYQYGHHINLIWWHPLCRKKSKWSTHYKWWPQFERRTRQGKWRGVALGQYCNTALGQYWFLICISLPPKWEAIPVLPRAHIHGQYWDLFQRGPVTLAPGQYWLLWHAWKLKSRVLTNVRTIPPQSKRRRQYGKILYSNLWARIAQGTYLWSISGATK